MKIRDFKENNQPIDYYDHIETQRRYDDKKNPEVLTGHEELIKRVDFNLLSSITGEILRKTDLHKQHLELFKSLVVSFTDKMQDLNKDEMGSYRPFSNRISFNFDALKSNSERAKSDPEIAFIFYLCHEIAHLITSHKGGGFTEDSGKTKKTKLVITSGYSTMVKEIDELSNKITEHTAYELFDEGITDELGMLIFTSYIKQRTELLRDEGQRVFNQVGYHLANHPYVLPRMVLLKLKQKISEATGFSEEDVWHAILRDKLESKGFEDPVLQDLIGEAFSRRFLKILETAETLEDFKLLLKIIDEPSGYHIKATAKRWLARLKKK